MNVGQYLLQVHKRKATSSGFKNILEIISSFFSLDLGNLFFEFSVPKVSFVPNDIRIHCFDFKLSS